MQTSIRYALVVLVVAVLCHACHAQTSTVSYSDAVGNIRAVSITYSTTNATAPYVTGVAATTRWINGRLLRFVMPATCQSSGTVSRITLTDADGVDLLGGMALSAATGAVFNLAPCMAMTDGTTTNMVQPVFSSTLTLLVTNIAATNACSAGEATLYYEGQ